MITQQIIKNVLELQELTIEVEGKVIIKNLSLSIPQGEVHAIMGPNGSGKSTLASALAGNPAYKITNGKIFLNGEDITFLSVEERAKRGIFLAFQYPLEIPGIFFGQYLYQIVKKRFPNLMFAEFQDRISTLLPLLGLDKKFLDRELNVGFSGGEKKRAEILQLLLLKPTFAILDETDSGLDIDSLKWVGNALSQAKQANDESFTALIITHYPKILAYLKPDKVHVFKEGKILASGPKELAEEIELKGYSSYTT